MSASTPDVPVWLPRQDGRVAVITGANSGIGWEAARMLAAVGARVVMACRRPEAAKAAVIRITEQVPDANIDVVQVDLAELASVSAGAAAVRELLGELRIDFLINNAGVLSAPTRAVTADAFELQMGVNHLGHFAWTLDLIDQLAARARVVQVASLAHKVGRMNFDDLLWLKSYNGWAAYARSKLANLLFVSALDRRLAQRAGKARKRAIAVACHPGYTATGLQAGFARKGSILEQVTRLGNAVLAQSAAAGAEPTVYAAVSSHVSGDDYVGPANFFQMRGPPVKVSRTAAACDTTAQERLWTESEALTGRKWT